MQKSFRVGLVQMAMSADPQENLDKAASRVEEAARKGAQVVCLPEMYRTPYFCQREDAALFDLAETVPGPSTERLSAVARKHDVALVVPGRGRRAHGRAPATTVPGLAPGLVPDFTPPAPSPADPR